MKLADKAIKAAEFGDEREGCSMEVAYSSLCNPLRETSEVELRFGGKDKKPSLGRYPDITLIEARTRRDDARALIAKGVDHGAQKQAVALASKLNAATTFKAVGEEYLKKASREGRAAPTIRNSCWLLSLMVSNLGALPVRDITPAQPLATLRKVEAKAHLETARRMRSLAGRIFRYAVATSRVLVPA